MYNIIYPGAARETRTTREICAICAQSDEVIGPESEKETFGNRAIDDGHNASDLREPMMCVCVLYMYDGYNMAAFGGLRKRGYIEKKGKLLGGER